MSHHMLTGSLLHSISSRGVLKGLDFFLLRTAPRDHQPPTTNRHQPPTATNHQPPTANRQPPTGNTWCARGLFWENCEHFFFPVKDRPDFKFGSHRLLAEEVGQRRRRIKESGRVTAPYFLKTQGSGSTAQRVIRIRMSTK